MVTHRLTHMPNTDPASPRTGLGKKQIIPIALKHTFSTASTEAFITFSQTFVEYNRCLPLYI